MMRALKLLLLALIVGTPSAASAQQVLYGFNFIRTSVSIDPRDATILPFLPEQSGSFAFDVGANQLTGFNLSVGRPLDYDTSSNYNGDPFPFVLALFNAAGPCDLACFIGAVNAGTYSDAYVSNRLTVRFGDPLNGSILGTGPGSSFRSINFGGVLSVTGPIPEPATWALMLMGFGAIGFRLRGSRRLLA